MSLERAEHPDRLPWYAGGQLDRVHAARIEQHLRGCPECRAEVDALRSMYASLRHEAPREHVSAPRLVAYHDGHASLRDVEGHVGVCHTCSADLTALREAEARSARARRTPRILGAAAALILVVAAGWRLVGSPELARVRFEPAQRGAQGTTVTGTGPWEFQVRLPLRAAASAYVARIHRLDNPSSPVFEANVEAGTGDDTVVFVVRSALEPGPHVLSLTPRGADESAADLRGFEVVRAP